jgi:predicted peptidase
MFGVIPVIEYAPTDQVTHPIKGVMLYLHGAGEIGTDLNLLERNPIPELFKSPSVVTKDYVIICPQLTAGTSWSSTNQKYLLELCERTMYKYNTTICELTGLSLGGFTSLGLMKEAYTKYGHGHFFTAVGLMCAKETSTLTLPFVEVPIKLWHGVDDTTNPISNMRAFKTRVNNAGGNVTLIEYTGVGHGVWDIGYQNANFWAFADTYGEVQGSDDYQDGYDAGYTAGTAAGVITGTAQGRAAMKAEAIAAADAALSGL